MLQMVSAVGFCENPFLHERAFHPRLRWRRAFGRECGSCPWVLDRHYSGVDRAELLLNMEDESTGERAKLQERREEWEAEKNASGGKRSAPSSSSASSSAGTKSPRPSATVSAYGNDMMEYRRLLGYVWPIKLYQSKNEGRNPPKKAIRTHNISGQKVRGVLLPESAGTPAGVVALWCVSQTGGMKSADLATTVEHGDEAVDEAWSAVQSKNQISSATRWLVLLTTN